MTEPRHPRPARARRPWIAAATAAAAVAGVSAGAAQAGTVEIVTNPPGASCVVRQEAQTQHVIERTPATVKILTFTEGIRVTCRAAGLPTAVFELGDPDTRRRSINGDDLDQSRSRQRRRFAALRRLRRIELDLYSQTTTPQSRPKSRFKLFSLF